MKNILTLLLSGALLLLSGCDIASNTTNRSDDISDITDETVDVSGLDTVPINSIIYEHLPDFDSSGFPNAESTGIWGCGLSVDDLQYSGPLRIKNGQVGTTVNYKFIPLPDDDPRITSGRIRYSENGIIIERLNIEGGIYMDGGGASGTVIRQCRISGGIYGIRCDSENEEVLIEYCTIFNEVVTYLDNGIVKTVRNEAAERKAVLAHNCTIRHCDISGYTDAVFLANNVIVDSNYIHDLYHYDPVWEDPDSTLDSTHSDGIQGGGENYTITNNTVEAINKNACIMMADQFDLEDVHIEGNYFIGGMYCVVVRGVLRTGPNGESGRDMENCLVKDNILYNDDTRHLFDTTYNDDNVEFINNIFYTGEPVGD